MRIIFLSLLKISKVKPWSICFDYDGKHYLIHGNYEIGEGSWQTLYERELDVNGKYTLNFIKHCNYAPDDVSRDYIKKQKGNTIVYRNIDKEHFIGKLIERGFCIMGEESGMICKDCGSQMSFEDRDYNFKGNYDNYWYCENCMTSCIEMIRFNKPFRKEWSNAR